MLGTFRGLGHRSVRATVGETLPISWPPRQPPHPRWVLTSAKYNFLTHTPPVPADSTGLFPGRVCLPALGWCRSPGSDHYHYFYVPTVCQVLCKILHILLASQVSWRDELFFCSEETRSVLSRWEWREVDKCKKIRTRPGWLTKGGW